MATPMIGWLCVDYCWVPAVPGPAVTEGLTRDHSDVTGSCYQSHQNHKMLGLTPILPLKTFQKSTNFAHITAGEKSNQLKKNANRPIAPPRNINIALAATRKIIQTWDKNR